MAKSQPRTHDRRAGSRKAAKTQQQARKQAETPAAKRKRKRGRAGPGSRKFKRVQGRDDLVVAGRPGHPQGGPPASVAVTEAMQRLVRRSQAFAMKVAGATFEQIGQHFGVSKRTAQLDVMEFAGEFDDMSAELLPRYRSIESARLDMALRNVMPLLQGNVGKTRTVKRGKETVVVAEVSPDRVADIQLRAADRVRTISESRRKLYGFDAPIRIAPTDPSGSRSYGAMDEAELERRIRELEQQMTVEPASPVDAVDGEEAAG